MSVPPHTTPIIRFGLIDHTHIQYTHVVEQASIQQALLTAVAEEEEEEDLAEEETCLGGLVNSLLVAISL
jgi:hypothetical protein